MKTKYQQLTEQEKKILKRYKLVHWHFLNNYAEGRDKIANEYYHEMRGLMYALSTFEIDYMNIKVPEDEQ